jgi:hypothetical protein
VVEEERVDGDGDDAGEEEEAVHAVQERVLRVVDLEGDALEVLLEDAPDVLEALRPVDHAGRRHADGARPDLDRAAGEVAVHLVAAAGFHGGGRADRIVQPYELVVAAVVVGELERPMGVVAGAAGEHVLLPPRELGRRGLHAAASSSTSSRYSPLCACMRRHAGGVLIDEDDDAEKGNGRSRNGFCGQTVVTIEA